MKTAIMGAMPQEVDILLSQMTDIESIMHGNRIYHAGKLNGHDVVLVFSRWGKVAAATTAATLIEKFKINQLIFTGVAGASTPDLNIGDIVISSQLFQHDMKSKFFPDGEIPLTGMILFKADLELARRAHRAASDLLKTQSFCENIMRELTALEVVNPNPKCVSGIIATGDQFIDNPQQLADIMRQQPDTLAVEMEGAAVAQVCHDYRIPFVIVRTISDGANHLSAEQFPVFVEKIACHYSKHIITNMFSDHNKIATVARENNAASLEV